MKDYYKILQVDPRAEREVIESAYRGLARKYRRDVNDSPAASRRLKALKEAYDVLRDPVKRAEYDGQRNRGAAPPSGSRTSAPRQRAVPKPQRSDGSSQAVLERAPRALALPFATPITARQVLLVTLLVTALFTRFWRLDTPTDKMFDEVYFPTTAQEILHGDQAAWEFYGHENTHPPLSKLIMAGGMGIFGENSFGWRFFGALAGVGSVLFIYLLGKRLFENEWVGLAAAFLMIFDGLAFTQARIATPDTYVLFFVLGSVYFLLSDRFALSGVFFGAAIACKWTALFTAFPIVLYLLYRHGQTEQARGFKLIYLAPLSLLPFYLGTPVLFGKWLLEGQSHLPTLSAPVFGTALVFWMLIWAVAPLGVYTAYRYWRLGEGRQADALRTSLLTQPLYFIVIPLYIYLLTYLPMLLNQHSLKDVWELNKAAYLFHSTLDATHPYQAPWDTWPILKRPVFFYLGSSPGNAKIYNLGNPVIFWLGLPALGFALGQGLRGLRTRLNRATGDLSVSGILRREEAAPLFVVLTYLAFWLSWAIQPRAMFLYHYLNALPFLMLALAYVVVRLWQGDWGQKATMTLLGVTAVIPVMLVLASASGGVGVVSFVGIGAVLLLVLALGDDSRLWQRWKDWIGIGAFSAVVALAFALATLILTRLDVDSNLSVVAAIALALGMAALAYEAQRRWQQPWGRAGAVAFLAVVFLTFVYFYPHLAAVPVSNALGESYFWFDSWR